MPKKPTAKKKTKRATKKAPHKIKRRIPRQNPLPGMENSKITAIENLALDYAEVRDQRQDLTTQESALKKDLLALMHKEGKTEYRRNGISVKVKVEEEKVIVRVKEEGELDTPELGVETPATEEAADAVS